MELRNFRYFAERIENDVFEESNEKMHTPPAQAMLIVLLAQAYVDSVRMHDSDFQPKVENLLRRHDEMQGQNTKMLVYMAI